jgi:hypothetical protein
VGLAGKQKEFRKRAEDAAENETSGGSIGSSREQATGLFSEKRPSSHTHSNTHHL